jgi:hypothetical protein
MLMEYFHLLLKFDEELKSTGVQLNMQRKIIHFIIGKTILLIIEMQNDLKKTLHLTLNFLQKNRKAEAFLFF